MLSINIRPYHLKFDLQSHKRHFNSQTKYKPELPVSSAKAIILMVLRMIGGLYDKDVYFCTKILFCLKPCLISIVLLLYHY